jgi:hypothetical protein
MQNILYKLLNIIMFFFFLFFSCFYVYYEIYNKALTNENMCKKLERFDNLNVYFNTTDINICKNIECEIPEKCIFYANNVCKNLNNACHYDPKISKFINNNYCKYKYYECHSDFYNVLGYIIFGAVIVLICNSSTIIMCSCMDNREFEFFSIIIVKFSVNILNGIIMLIIFFCSNLNDQYITSLIWSNLLILFIEPFSFGEIFN